MDKKRMIKNMNKMIKVEQVWKNKLLILLLASAFVIIAVLLTTNVNAAASVCCEKTTYGALCQNAPIEQCANTTIPPSMRTNDIMSNFNK